jgi:predicted nucleic-acid-binding protein
MMKEMLLSIVDLAIVTTSRTFLSREAEATVVARLLGNDSMAVKFTYFIYHIANKN